jgi:hypothetical protein
MPAGDNLENLGGKVFERYCPESITKKVVDAN